MTSETNLSRQRWEEQKNRAGNRRIAFLLTYEQWRAWWQAELAARGPGARRGLGNGGLVMCRFGDKGAYEVGNIFAGTQSDNNRDMHARGGTANGIAAMKAYRAEHGCWLSGTTGAAHPRSRAIVAGDISFPSVTAAAAHFGVSRTEIRRRIAAGRL